MIACVTISCEGTLAEVEIKLNWQALLVTRVHKGGRKRVWWMRRLKSAGLWPRRRIS